MSAPRVEIVVDRRAARLWHRRLAERLAKSAQVRIRAAEGAQAFPPAVEWVLRLERALARQPRPRLCDAMAPPAPASDDFQPTIVVDCTGREPQAHADGARVLRPLYNGLPEELAAAAALLAGACPSIALQDMGAGGLAATGLPSLEGAEGLTGGLEAIFSRLTLLIERAILAPRRAGAPAPAAAAPKPIHAARFVLRNVARDCARRIYRLCCHSPHWRVGWRWIEGPGVLEAGDLSGAPFRALPDMGAAFAADPFPVSWRGKAYIFFERLEHRVGKGMIFAQEMSAAGPVGAPQLALEEPWHLSYPFLIEHGGALYMLPEASLSNAATLYRCVDFPSRWEPVAQLLSGIEAADATIFRHAERFWMTSVVREGVGGYSDTLAIHHAPDLFGPWQEHASRPVLVDSRCARPAGAVVAMDGALWRPVQDCAEGYGKRLALARIDALDQETFAQTVVKTIAPGPLWPGDRLHTLNRYGPLECIDGAVLTPKPRALRPLANALGGVRA